MRDFPKMRVEELKEILKNDYGYDTEMVDSIKGKAMIVGLVKQEDDKAGLADSVSFGDETSNGDFVPETIVPVVPKKSKLKPSNPTWNDHVMKQFLPDELIDGRPTVDGLRRVAENLLGTILEISSTVVQVPTHENGMRSTVKVSVVFEYILGQSQRYEGVADVCELNAKSPYFLHPTSTAETKAEGRALRKALKLRRILSAEEMGASTNTPESNAPANITDTQITFIDLMCGNTMRGMNIDVIKLVNYYGYNVTNIKKLKHEDSLALQKILSDFQNDTAKIPMEIIGYDAGWRNTFAI
jgi:hypothetical protein